MDFVEKDSPLLLCFYKQENYTDAVTNYDMAINLNSGVIYDVYNDKIDGMWFQTYKDLTNGILCQ